MDEAPEEPPESGEVETLRSALEKAEKAMKGAQSRMTKATQEAADLRRQNEDMLKNLTELKGQLAEKERDTAKLAQIREISRHRWSLLDELSRRKQRYKAPRKL